MPAPLFLVVAYDIVSNRRRNRIVNILKDYGQRVNYSVFECTISRQREQELRARITEVINSKEDRVLLYRLCAACRNRRDVLGLGLPAWEAVTFINGKEDE